MRQTIYDFTVPLPEGGERSLQEYAGRPLLIVNVASRCGFTPQYEGLEQLQKAYGEKGFSVMGFPCNQFGKQEPGDAEEIKSFCKLSYDVSFPLFAKVEVNGARALPLYRFLKEQRPGLLGTRAIKWNFTKFLVDREGRVTARFAPTVKPEELRPAIEALLKS